jgi:cyclopropane fatty-acyl-phospholipid synthase-like methyltransferase
MELSDFKHKIKRIKNKSFSYVCNFINTELNNFKYLEHEYKHKNKFDKLSLLAQLFPLLKNQNNMDSSFMDLLILINSSMHGQRILIKYRYIIEKQSNETIAQICNLSSNKWTCPVFYFYADILIKKHLTYIFNTILANSFANTDDRIYKLIITNEYYKKYITDYDPICLIDTILYNIRSNFIPNKYILKRLRYLNILIPSLKLYFNIIFSSFYDKYEIIPIIMKYYYNDIQLTSENIKKYSIIINYNYNPRIAFFNLYNILNTDIEKNQLITHTLFITGKMYTNIIDGDNNFMYLKTIIEEHFISLTCIVKEPLKHMNTIDLYNFIKNFSMYNIASCIDIIDDLKVLFYLLPFVVLNKGKYAKQFNIVRYTITKYIKNIKNKKTIIRKLKLYPLINEIKNLTSNSKPVLMSESMLFSNIKQKFNTVPPYHLFPGQLQNMDINKHFLLKEKADGILVFSVPKELYPNNPFTTQIKAEYIENLDLYLVFDIDINYNICDRHLQIHNYHKYGQKMIPIINNLDEMKNAINYEREQFKKFLSEPYDNYRWYPKPAWYINNITNFIEPFTDLINMNNSIDKWIIMNNNDGLILTPLDGSREIKIKPKNLYTIDLLFINNKWLDSDNNEYNINININNNYNNNYNNTIYRCYPENNSYIPKDIRPDKIKPNSSKLINLIMSLHKTEYKYDKYESIYNTNINTNINTNTDWTKIINNNNNSIKIMLNKIIKLKHSPNIIDFGCGSGKILKYLKNYNNYIGVDMDINMLAKAINKYSFNDKIMFSYSDISKDINGWVPINNNYYDIILCINSIMHFNTESFWEQLSKIKKNSSFILLNLVNMENGTTYNKNDIYMERKDNYVYYKFPIHNNIKKESYIDINSILDRGYKIIDEYSNNESFTNFYKWYILTKV